MKKEVFSKFEIPTVFSPIRSGIRREKFLQKTNVTFILIYKFIQIGIYYDSSFFGLSDDIILKI